MIDIQADAASLASLRVTRIIAGDESAFEDLYDQYAQALLNVAFRILGNQAEAEEVLQETFVVVWDRARSFDSRRGQVWSWLLAIIKSRALDRLRSRRASQQREQRHTLERSDSELTRTSPVEACELGEQRQRVRQALGQLSPSQRQIVEMSYYQGLSQSAIAQQLDIPLGTVKTRARQGLAILRAALV